MEKCAENSLEQSGQLKITGERMGQVEGTKNLVIQSQILKEFRV